MNTKHPPNIVQQAEEHGKRATDLFDNLYAGTGMTLSDQRSFALLIGSTVKVAFLNGWDAAIGKLDDGDER